VQLGGRNSNSAWQQSVGLELAAERRSGSVGTRARSATPPAQPATGVITDQDLAKSAHNPFEDFVKLFPKFAP
jgi:hypothetical protein